MTVHVCNWALAFVVAALFAVPVSAQPQADGIVPYRATYEIFEGNKRVGRSTVTLSYDVASAQYRFESRSRFRGLLRLAAPRPVVERSDFVVAGGAIRPIMAAYEDGTRRGRRNITLKFDWSADVLAIEQRDGPGMIPLEPGTLDRGSVRVALMRDLARGYGSGIHVLADPDVIRAYSYAVESTQTIETAIGEIRAHRILQRRDGSSRHTLFWLAPNLNFLSLRMEQHRQDRDAIAFVIESVEWLEDGDFSARND